MADIQQPSETLNDSEPHSGTEVELLLGKTSWEALRPDIINELCKDLDDEQHLKTEKGVFRDWRGLQMLTKLNNDEIVPPKTSNSTKQFLTFLKEKQKELSVKDLLENLVHMDRYDVIAKLFEKRPNAKHPMIIEDCHLAQMKYDTILLYAKDDQDFALDLKSNRLDTCKLETYVYDYNIQPDNHSIDSIQLRSEHDVRLIMAQKRCKHIIVIFSPAFLESPAYLFLVKDVCELNAHFRPSCPIVPIIWKECGWKSNLHFKYVSDITYTRNGIVNFYERLLCTTLGVKKEDLKWQVKKYHFMGEDDIARVNVGEVRIDVNKRKLPWLKKIRRRLKARKSKRDDCVQI